MRPIASLFTIAKTWKQLQCPSTEEMRKEDVVPPCSGPLLSHEKERRKAVRGTVDRSGDCPTKRRQTEENKRHMILLICGILKNNTQQA